MHGRIQLGVIAAITLLSLTEAHAQIQNQQGLDFGVVTQNTTYNIPNTHTSAARWRIRTMNACPNPTTISFPVVPTVLSAGINTIPISYSATSARVTQEAAPMTFVEFNPQTGSASIPVSWYPVTVTLGASITTGPTQVVGSYLATGVTIQRDFHRQQGPICNPVSQQRSNAQMTAEIQPSMSVTANNGPIDLGLLFLGTSISIPADNSGAFSSAQFSVSGPAGLDWQLDVTLSDLSHTSMVGTAPLTLTSGLYGQTVPPTLNFSNGQVVAQADHGGALEVWLGYDVTVPGAAPLGSYQGSLTLTVEALLN